MWLRLFMVLVFAWAVENVLKIFWLPPYFRKGIPLFRRTFTCLPETRADLDAARLSRETGSCLYGSLQFHRLGPREWAFRESALGVLLLHGPLMRGIVWVGDDPPVAGVVGYLNAFPLCWVCFGLVFLLLEEPWLALPVGLPPVAGLLASYLVEARRLNELFNAVRERFEPP